MADRRGTPGPPDPDLLRGALARAIATVRANLAAWSIEYPDDCTRGGLYAARPARPALGLPAGANWGWTTGFVPGMQWLAWQATGEAPLAAAARAHVARFAERLLARTDLDTHDLGFLYTLSCVVPHDLLGDEAAGETARAAADHLLGRVLPSAGIVQAWGDLDDPAQRGRTIIDSLMNMPLLYWAGAVAGEARYGAAAMRHTEQLRDRIIRPDGTTYHTFAWDPVTGEPLRGQTAQGYSDASCWARGQAWGIYGFALGARHTGDDSFRRAAARLADVFWDRLPADRVPYWDLAFADGADQPRDSSAGAVAAAGLLELAALCEDRAEVAGQVYAARADAILTALASRYVPADPAVPGSPLLLHGVYNLPGGEGVDEGTLWGDYFYLEALCRRVGPAWRSYW